MYYWYFVFGRVKNLLRKFYLLYLFKAQAFEDPVVYHEISQSSDTIMRNATMGHQLYMYKTRKLEGILALSSLKDNIKPKTKRDNLSVLTSSEIDDL